MTNAVEESNNACCRNTTGLLHHRSSAMHMQRRARRRYPGQPASRASSHAGHTNSGATGRHALALRHHAEHMRLCAPVCMGRADVTRPRARQPVDAEQVAVSGVHCVLLQRVALRVHQRCMQRVALILHSMLALPSAGRIRRTPPAARKGAPDMGGSAGSFGWGKEFWHVARCVALTDDSTAAASSACSILAGSGSLRRARGSSLAALLPRQANNLVCRDRTGACCTVAVPRS